MGVETKAREAFTEWESGAMRFSPYTQAMENMSYMDGCGVDPFGIKSFGVHLTAYDKTEDGSTKYWVPRRAKTKRTYPGMLDNTVG